jgi:hypothetical protein
MAAKMQPFMLPRGGGAMKATIGMVPPKPDYYPTANLGIDAVAFRQVGGFRAMRGGGDLDICWRIQEQKLGTIATDTRVLMEWEPRTSLRDLASQWKRYGHSNAYIRWVSRQDGATHRTGGQRHRRPGLSVRLFLSAVEARSVRDARPLRGGCEPGLRVAPQRSGPPTCS